MNAYYERVFVLLLVTLTVVVGTPLVSTGAGPDSSDPQWIWSPEHKKGDVPQESCYYRKTIYLPGEHRGELYIAADDDYEAYVNGKKVAEGTAHRRMDVHSITSYLRPGKNIIAIKVTNRNGNTAGLAGEIVVESDEVPRRRYVTDSTWRTSISVLPLWYTSGYRDRRWDSARVFGPFGREGGEKKVPPQVAQKNASADATSKSGRQGEQGEHPEFKVGPGFQIQHVVGGMETGSLIAMAFNEFGEILISQEGGPLMVVYDSNANDIPDAVRVVCDHVTSCQGILPLNGMVYVVGDGPSGVALYRLEDVNRDGTYEEVASLVEFDGALGEHGPHGLVQGPDGWIYVAIGNYTKVKRADANTSPYRHAYEGDMVPRYEDPMGHAAGIKAPGGGVLRITPDGQRMERVAGGVRNAYDLAFNRDGDLFMHDSDMESDEGTPWARPTRLLHIVPGGEYGWRSGWGKWPTYWLDSLPATLDTGRGSPAGCVFYDHPAYPAKYRHSFFSCDWAGGRILSVQLKREGATYTAESTTFLEGRPLNVTDIDVSPSGWLYFCTGGRGTQGNLYRVIYERTNIDPDETEKEEVGILPAIHQAQPRSAWGRQKISELRQQLGREWDFEIRAFIKDRSQPAADRAQALELMHLVGPPPSDVELATMAKDPEPDVRWRAAKLMGLIGNETARKELTRLVADPQPQIRRAACESLARIATPISFDDLKALLAASDRFESFAARRLLEVGDSATWERHLLAINQPVVFAQGAAARLIADPDKDTAIQITNRAAALAQQPLPDVELLPLLRVMELAIERGQLTGPDLPIVGTWLAKQFPHDDPSINRELTRLLIALQNSEAVDRMIAFIESDAPHVERLHVGLQMRFLQKGWTPAQKARLLAFYETAGDVEGGRNLGAYVDHVTSDFLLTCTKAERQAVLAHGDRMPNMAFATLFQLPESEYRENVDVLINLDRKLPQSTAPGLWDLRVGLLAILAQSGEERGMTYLREVYDRDPERRPAAAMGLAQMPEDRNWDYLVRSIPILDDEPAKEVLIKLRQVDYAPEEIEHYRQLILCGLRLRDDGGMLAAELLEHWVGKKPENAGDTWDTALPAWQAWFQDAHPTKPSPTLPEEKGQNLWSVEDLEAFLGSENGNQGSVERGKLVYEKIQCAKCHIHGRIGENFGPELTSLARRFRKSEILESILFPSQVVSDQYVSYQMNLTDGRSISGQVIPKSNTEFLIVQSNGESATVAEEDIVEIVRSNVSPMPDGLLNELSLQEIADLFAFLMADPGATVARNPE